MHNLIPLSSNSEIFVPETLLEWFPQDMLSLVLTNFQTFFFEQIRQNSNKVIRRYAQQQATYEFSGQYFHF